MALRENNAEGFANGVSVAASQSGSGSPFDVVSITGSASATYSSSAAAHQTQSYKITALSGSTALVRFSGGAATTTSVRVYILLNAASTTFQNIVEVRDTAGQQAAGIGLNNGSQVQIKDASGAPIKGFTTVLALNTWYRIELQVSQATTTTGTISGALYLGDATTPMEAAYSSSTVNAGTTSMSYVNYGKLTSGASLDAQFDDIAWNHSTAAPIGPAIVNNTPPTANAGADVINIEPYSLVSLSGSDADADGTITSRSWVQVSGTTVALTGSGTNRTYIAPGTISGTTLIFGYQVTDNGGATSTQDTVSHTILPVTERAVIAGVEVPVNTKVVVGGSLI